MFCIAFIADMLMLASLVLPIGVKCPACYFSVSIAFVRSNSRSVQIHRVVLFCFVEELDASHFCSLFLYYFLNLNYDITRKVKGTAWSHFIVLSHGEQEFD